MVNFIDEPVKINITRMRAIARLENFFEGQADFYPEIEIDGKALGGEAGFKIEGDNDVSPNGRWTFDNTVSQRFVPIRIKILEADSASGNDAVDINPIGGENVLNLTYDLLTQEVKDESGTVLGAADQEITLRGNNRRINGEISFKISGVVGPEADNTLIKQDSSPTRNNFFGQDVAAKDINNDNFDDLVIGAPGEDRAQGAVHAVFGNSSGLRVPSSFSGRPLFFKQGSSSVAGNPDDFDRFGTSVAIGNFNGSAGAEIAVGVPNEDIGNTSNPGLVNIVPT